MVSHAELYGRLLYAMDKNDAHYSQDYLLGLALGIVMAIKPDDTKEYKDLAALIHKARLQGLGVRNLKTKG